MKWLLCSKPGNESSPNSFSMACEVPREGAFPPPAPVSLPFSEGALRPKASANRPLMFWSLKPFLPSSAWGLLPIRTSEVGEISLGTFPWYLYLYTALTTLIFKLHLLCYIAHSAKDRARFCSFLYLVPCKLFCTKPNNRKGRLNWIELKSWLFLVSRSLQ